MKKKKQTVMTLRQLLKELQPAELDKPMATPDGLPILRVIADADMLTFSDTDEDGNTGECLL